MPRLCCKALGHHGKTVPRRSCKALGNHGNTCPDSAVKHKGTGESTCYFAGMACSTQLLTSKSEARQSSARWPAKGRRRGHQRLLRQRSNIDLRDLELMRVCELFHRGPQKLQRVEVVNISGAHFIDVSVVKELDNALRTEPGFCKGEQLLNVGVEFTQVRLRSSVPGLAGLRRLVEKLTEVLEGSP